MRYKVEIEIHVYADSKEGAEKIIRNIKTQDLSYELDSAKLVFIDYVIPDTYQNENDMFTVPYAEEGNNKSIFDIIADKPNFYQECYENYLKEIKE